MPTMPFSPAGTRPEGQQRTQGSGGGFSATHGLPTWALRLNRATPHCSPQQHIVHSMPQHAQRSSPEPAVSVPSAKLTSPPATADALPQEEPPGMNLRQGSGELVFGVGRRRVHGACSTPCPAWPALVVPPSCAPSVLQWPSITQWVRAGAGRPPIGSGAPVVKGIGRHTIRRASPYQTAGKLVQVGLAHEDSTCQQGMQGWQLVRAELHSGLQLWDSRVCRGKGGGRPGAEPAANRRAPPRWRSLAGGHQAELAANVLTAPHSYSADT